MALHVRFESWYMSLPSSAKQQHKMTKLYRYFGEREPQWLIFLSSFGIECGRTRTEHIQFKFKFSLFAFLVNNSNFFRWQCMAR